MNKTYATVTVFDKIDFLEELTKETWEKMLISELHNFRHNHFGDVWTCGLYYTVDDAKEIVEKNITDIQEGCYDYAIVEEYQYGTYPFMGQCFLYKWDNENKCFIPYDHPFLHVGFQGFTFLT